MIKITSQQILDTLKSIFIPGQAKDIVTSNKVSSIVIREKAIGFAIELTNEDMVDQQVLTQECEAIIKKNFPIENISIVFTKENAPTTSKTNYKEKQVIPGIKKIIAVSSCKGGVGKSTTAVNLSAYFAANDYKIGLADIDIYGPSLPKMLGLKELPLIEGNMMLPIEKFRLKTISMGYLLDSEKAAIWRGPMTTKALSQLLKGTKWGELDILFIDMPPGTGDIHLSLLENYHIDGVILVSTPQEVALSDVRKSINMYQKMDVRILGLIENMSYFKDPLSNNKSYIFGEGGVKKLAKEKNLPFLGEVPLSITLRQSADIGIPTAFSKDADSEVVSAYKEIITKIEAALK